MSPPSDLSIQHLAVRGMPGSGTGQELLAWAGIDAEHIAEAARQLVKAGTLIGPDGSALRDERP